MPASSVGSRRFPAMPAACYSGERTLETAVLACTEAKAPKIPGVTVPAAAKHARGVQREMAGHQN